MSLTLLLIGGITALVLFLFSTTKKRPPSFPPGPRPWPILGNLLQAGLEPHKGFIKLGKQYGPIFSFDFGSLPAVVVNDLKLIKQLLNENAFTGRPKFHVFLLRAGAKFCRGIITSERSHWVEQRRFALRNLRDFGFGKTSMEGLMHEEITEFLESLRQKVDKPLQIRGLFNAAVLNSLWRIVTGARTPQNDPKLQKLIDVVISGFSGGIALVLFFPKLCQWIPRLSGYQAVVDVNKPLKDFVQEALLEHKATFVPGQPRDLMDSVCEEIAETQDPNSSFYKEEGEMNAIKSLEDLFLGGAETTGSSLNWICLIMALNPEIQEKLQDEIQKVVGSSRLPNLTDKPNMPYTECVVMETLRFVTILPLGLFHVTLEEVHLGGYVIPKDIIIIPNLYAVLHNKDIWGDPDTFRPERFLLTDGTVNRAHDAFIPFSSGKRVCIGEKLARDELFLFTSSLFQQFQVRTDPRHAKPTLKCSPTVVLNPQPHQLIFEERT